MPDGSGGPPPGERLRTLRGLSTYACGHTGSCCHAGWPIPIESTPLRLIRDAAQAGRLPSTAVAWFNDGVLGHSAEGACAFHRAGTGPGCRLESELGAQALPFSCRQFPRLLLRDARGWHVSLSAWCGTAAGHICDPVVGSHEPTPDPSSFLSIDHIQSDPRVHVEALDAHEAWPPLLKPGVLAGHDTYELWEMRLMAECLNPVTRGHGQTGPALASALCWTDGLRNWSAADGCLFVRASKPIASRSPQWLRLWQKPELKLRTVLGELMADVPTEWRVPDWPAGLTDASEAGPPVTRTQAEAALARYLGTRLFGSWVSYQGQGLRSVLASMVSAYVLAVLALDANGAGTPTLGRMTSAIRASDWVLLHLLDRQAWANWCSRWEGPADASNLVTLVAAAHETLDRLPWTEGLGGAREVSASSAG